MNLICLKTGFEVNSDIFPHPLLFPILDSLSGSCVYIFSKKKKKIKNKKKNVKKLTIRRDCKHWEGRQKLEDIITADVILQRIYWF